MKRFPAFVLLFCFFLVSAAAAESHTVTYFYRNYCESCTPEDDFAAQFQSLTGISLSDCAFTAWNVVRTDGQAALEKTLAELGLEQLSLPAAIVDGNVYQGAAEMNTQLAETALSWQETTDSVILYLYTPACESCAAVESVLNNLPESVTVQRGNVSFESRVLVRKLDISQIPGTAEALFARYEVPDSRRVTPAVFFGSHVLTGEKEITDRLGQEILLGWASGGVPLPEGDVPLARPSLLPSIGAGIVAGLNTCALSMLLLFLSLILPTGRRAPALAFLAAKLVCYLLIGFVFLELLQRYNPHWLRPLSRWLMTGIGAVLILLNLSDAYHAYRNDLGSVRNQLPSGLRGQLHRLIRSLTGTRILTASSALLGFLVAGGEFMCAGQLYLIQLISFAHYESGQVPALIAYCLAFLLPSAVVCAVVFYSHSHLRTAAFFAEHMTLVKVLTALAMLMLILLAWLI